VRLAQLGVDLAKVGYSRPMAPDEARPRLWLRKESCWRAQVVSFLPRRLRPACLGGWLPHAL